MFRFNSKSGYSGNYNTWAAAQAQCSGYDQANILVKVRDAALAVKEGRAVYERDSVLFDRFECSWPVFGLLMKAAYESAPNLSVVDFGGSLGSSYYNVRSLLPQGLNCRWNVIEQPSFVEVGQQIFQDEQLKFYLNLADLPSRDVDVLLLSSVLPYLEDPMAELRRLIQLNARYLIIDRTPCFKDFSQLTKQVVPDWIYQASYPAWFLNQAELLDVLSDKYEVLSIYDALAGSIKVGGKKAKEIGIICRLKD